MAAAMTLTMIPALLLSTLMILLFIGDGGGILLAFSLAVVIALATFVVVTVLRIASTMDHENELS